LTINKLFLTHSAKELRFEYYYELTLIIE